MENLVKTCKTCGGLFSHREEEYCNNVCARREIVLLSADAGILGSTARTKGGAWSYCLIGHNGVLLDHKTGFTDRLTTSPQMEVLALIKGLEALPEGWTGVVESDCMYALKMIECLTDPDTPLIHDGKVWKENKLHPQLKRQRDALKLGYIVLRHLSGHPTREQRKTGIGKKGRPVSEWNVLNDSACTELMEKMKVEEGK